MHITRVLAPCALLSALATPALAGPGTHGCYWDIGGSPMGFVRNFGTVYVPRDAPIGSVIGQARVNGFADNNHSQVACENWGGPPVRFDAIASAPLVPPPPASGNPGYDPTRLFSTDVPGVAVQIEFDSPFTYPKTGGAFAPDDGLPPIAPFQSTMLRRTVAFSTTYSGGYTYLTLVKVGPIPPGHHSVTPRTLFTGSFTDLGHALTFAVTGTVMQAQCDVSAATPTHVSLGDWSTSDFKGPGFTTPAVNFNVELQNCMDDPANGATDIYLRFDPQNGSTTLDQNLGLFSLVPTSSAAGIGVQVLRGDGTPMPLNDAVNMRRLPAAGQAPLQFQARFYQTGPSQDVKGGDAQAFLGFTITYL